MSTYNVQPGSNATCTGLGPWAQDYSPSGPGVFSLTPEALLMYCETQLNSLDSDIQKYMDDQRTQLARKSILQDLETSLKNNNTVKKEKGMLKHRQHAIADAYATTYAELKAAGFNDEAARVKADFKKAFPNGDIGQKHPSIKGNTLPTSTESEFERYTQPVTDLIDEIGKNAELNMIKLQSIMSKRQQAIQLTTNMMAKLDRGLDSITANFK